MSWGEAVGTTCLVTAIAFVGVPVIVYLCAKFGTFGVLKAKDQFDQQKKESENGKQQGT